MTEKFRKWFIVYSFKDNTGNIFTPLALKKKRKISSSRSGYNVSFVVYSTESPKSVQSFISFMTQSNSHGLSSTVLY